MKQTTATAAKPQIPQAPGKISEFVDTLSSHGIYNSTGLKQSFKDETGLDAPAWPEYSAAETVAAIEGRGLGGDLDMAAAKACPSAYGWEIAESIATKFAGFQGSAFFGRGFRFWAAVEAVRKAGL